MQKYIHLLRMLPIIGFGVFLFAVSGSLAHAQMIPVAAVPPPSMVCNVWGCYAVQNGQMVGPIYNTQGQIIQNGPVAQNTQPQYQTQQYPVQQYPVQQNPAQQYPVQQSPNQVYYPNQNQNVAPAPQYQQVQPQYNPQYPNSATPVPQPIAGYSQTQPCPVNCVPAQQAPTCGGAPCGTASGYQTYQSYDSGYASSCTGNPNCPIMPQNFVPSEYYTATYCSQQPVVQTQALAPQQTIVQQQVTRPVSNVQQIPVQTQQIQPAPNQFAPLPQCGCAGANIQQQPQQYYYYPPVPQTATPRDVKG